MEYKKIHNSLWFIPYLSFWNFQHVGEFLVLRVPQPQLHYSSSQLPHCALLSTALAFPVLSLRSQLAVFYSRGLQKLLKVC